jgi:hypothetical protein
MRETVPSFLYSTLVAAVGEGGGGIGLFPEVVEDGIETWMRWSWCEREKDK